MSKKLKPTNEDGWLAAEYALGVLDSKARADAARRIEKDPQFRQSVEGWNDQLLPLLDEVEEKVPSSSVWNNIANQTAPSQSRQGVVASGLGVWKLLTALSSTAAIACVGLLFYATGGDFTGQGSRILKQELASANSQIASGDAELTAARASLETVVAERDSLLGRFEEQAAAFAQADEALAGAREQVASLITQRNEAMELADVQGEALEDIQVQFAEAKEALKSAEIRYVQLQDTVSKARPLVASLTQSGDLPSFVAQYDPLKKALFIRTELADEDEKVPEIWLIPAQGEKKGEVLSLGTMNEKAPDQLLIEDDFVPLIGEGGTLAITMEPVGGAPNGVATGPIIALGNFQSF
ncbi:MAG: anti-sigma factor [Pseudomonadota bacterium]